MRLSESSTPAKEKEVIAQELSELNDDFKKINRRFLELNVGAMQLVEDDKVEDALTKIRDCYHEETCSEGSLLFSMQQLAHACRDSVGAEWQVNVSERELTKEDFEKLRH